jgi:Phage tail tube protein, GTA-gp10
MIMLGANAARGEVVGRFGEETHRLCLTIGALAELEAALKVNDLMALLERFAGGRISAREAALVVMAGLKGGGLRLDEAALERLVAGRPAMEMIGNAARLLNASFG